MLVVPSDPGRPSGLGCAATGGSKCPRDPFQQPAEREARVRSHAHPGPALPCATSGDLLLLKRASWKWRRWLLETAPDSYQIPDLHTLPECSSAFLAVSLSSPFLSPLLSGHSSWPRSTHSKEVQNPGSLSTFYERSDRLHGAGRRGHKIPHTQPLPSGNFQMSREKCAQVPSFLFFSFEIENLNLDVNF